jgi:hypothetical protein
VVEPVSIASSPSIISLISFPLTQIQANERQPRQLKPIKSDPADEGIASDLEKLVLQSHVVLRLETDTGSEDVGESTSLLSKSVDDWSSGRSQWSLEHVAEDAKHAVEVLEILGGNTAVGGSLPLNAGHHLSNQD